MGPLRLLLIAIVAVILGAIPQGHAADLRFCSSLNTGSDFKPVSNIFQSHGECRDTCVENYALAVVLGKDCWCSNAVPGDTTSIDDCDTNCPGYPSEKCGSFENEYYAYVQLDKRPSTTVGGPTSSSSPRETETSTKRSTTPVTVTVTHSDGPVSTTSPTTSTEESSTFTTSTASTTTSDRNGEPVTVTADPTSTSTSESGSDEDSAVSGGAIAGIVIGSLAGVAILAVLIWFFCIYRRRKQPKEETYSTSFFERPVPRPHFQGTLGPREAALGNVGTNKSNGNVHPPGPTQRLSVPAFTDSRLNSNMYPNGSRLSNVSLNDHQDYSRPVLRLTNPDPA